MVTNICTVTGSTGGINIGASANVTTVLGTAININTTGTGGVMIGNTTGKVQVPYGQLYDIASTPARQNAIFQGTWNTAQNISDTSITLITIYTGNFTTSTNDSSVYTLSSSSSATTLSVTSGRYLVMMSPNMQFSSNGYCAGYFFLNGASTSGAATLTQSLYAQEVLTGNNYVSCPHFVWSGTITTSLGFGFEALGSTSVANFSGTGTSQYSSLSIVRLI